MPQSAFESALGFVWVEDGHDSIQFRMKLWLDEGCSDLDLLRSNTGSSIFVGSSDQGRFVLKRYVDRGFYGFRSLFFAPRVVREARVLQWLHDRIDNPIKPLAYGSVRHGLTVTSVLATSEFAGSRSLTQLVDPIEADIVPALVATVSALHEAQVYAKTLYGKNLLYQAESKTVAVIDLPRARLGRELSVRERLHDLACLGKDCRRTLSQEAWIEIVQGIASRRPFPGNFADLINSLEARIVRLRHKTPASRWLHSFGRRFRKSSLGQALGAK